MTIFPNFFFERLLSGKRQGKRNENENKLTSTSQQDYYFFSCTIFCLFLSCCLLHCFQLTIGAIKILRGSIKQQQNIQTKIQILFRLIIFVKKQTLKKRNACQLKYQSVPYKIINSSL